MERLRRGPPLTYANTLSGIALRGFDHCGIYLNELPIVAEPCDPKQGGGRDCPAEELHHRRPGCRERSLFPDNIDDQSPDVGGSEPVNHQDCAQIQQTLRRLGLRVAVCNDAPKRVVGHLARNEQLVADALRVLVLGRRGEAGTGFSFIHGSNIPSVRCDAYHPSQDAPRRGVGLNDLSGGTAAAAQCECQAYEEEQRPAGHEHQIQQAVKAIG